MVVGGRQGKNGSGVQPGGNESTSRGKKPTAIKKSLGKNANQAREKKKKQGKRKMEVKNKFEGKVLGGTKKKQGEKKLVP